MRRPRRLLGAAVVVCALATDCAGPVAMPSPTLAQSGAVPSLADEFDGPAGAPADAALWQADVGGKGWGNKELQFYTDGANTFLDGNGNLVIEARRAGPDLSCWYGPCEFTSGKLTTKTAFSQRYGRFEARMKAPVGQGVWPAFWLLGDNIDAVGHPDCGEIDVMETLGHQPAVVQQHAIGPGPKFGARHTLPPGQSISDWHVYAVEWSPDSIVWQVDGRPTLIFTKEQAGAVWVFDHPFYLLINLAVGGEWPGAPDEDTVFPARLLIDYVRVYAPGV